MVQVMKNSELPKGVWPRRTDSVTKPGTVIFDLWDEKNEAQYCRVEFELLSLESKDVIEALDHWTDGLREDNVI